MTRGKLVANSGKVIVEPCLRTSNIFERLRGLLLRPAPVDGSGLLIDPCASVHTFAMTYPIDIVYLDRNYRVLRTIDGLAPWRVSACKAARMTLELAAGQARALGVERSQQLQWQSV
jgi:uncharacterized protein